MNIIEQKIQKIILARRRFLLERHYFLRSKKRFKNVGLLKEELSSVEVKAVDEYWRTNYGRKISLLFHQGFRNYLGFWGDSLF